MPSKLSVERQKQAAEEALAAEQKAHAKGKQNSGGEASKHAKSLQGLEAQQHDIDIAEGQDNKKGNIGPSGQGTHRGRERRNRQSKASGRPDASAATQSGLPG